VLCDAPNQEPLHRTPANGQERGPLGGPSWTEARRLLCEDGEDSRRVEDQPERSEPRSTATVEMPAGRRRNHAEKAVLKAPSCPKNRSGVWSDPLRVFVCP